MTVITLIGIDPGIVDTAVVVLTLNPLHKEWKVDYRVWTEVVKTDPDNKFGIIVDSNFLTGLQALVTEAQRLPGLHRIGIEGFRQRGRNSRQDQKMLALIRDIESVLKKSKVIDNTGIKKVVKEPLLKLFAMHRFPGTNHADLKSAARVALKLGIAEPTINLFLSDFVRDTLRGNKWLLVSTLTR